MPMLPGKREQPGLECLVEPAGGREASAPALERTQPQLPEALALEQGPVVVPVRQEVEGERLRRGSPRASRELGSGERLRFA